MPGAADQPVILAFDVRADRAGGGDVCWREGKAKGFSPDRRKRFTIDRPGEWEPREVTIDLDGPLDALRIDPINAAGSADLRNVRLMSPRGEVLADHRMLD